MKRIFLCSCLLIMLFSMCSAQTDETQNWTHFVRIGGNPLSYDKIDSIIQKATETNVFGIEVDNDITGRYESFLNPEEKLNAIRTFSEKAHEIGNYSFVYIAGLEIITADADNSETSFFKDHPDWAQRDLDGNPAVFGSESAFWIVKGDEDVWITPYASEWRKLYMKHVRQIAATGIDGIYVDIPYWMTHFEGWEDTWASFDDYTVRKFKDETGLNAKTELVLGDFSDSNFRKWVDFRINTITEFMQEIDENIKSVNPECKTIAEIYPGPGFDAVVVGADVYELYDVVDVIGHEYSEGGYMAANREPLDWFRYMIGMYSFRAFAEGKASWMLSYSWDGENNVRIDEAMKNLAMSHIIAGTNTWDAHGHIMSSSNNYQVRKQIFDWIAKHEKLIYAARKPINPIGIYFSPKTRNYFTDEFISSYTGMMMLLLNKHLEFQIITPRTLNQFEGSILILSDVKCLDEKEIVELDKYYLEGNKLIVTGETGKYDCDLNEIKPSFFSQKLNISESDQKEISSGKYIIYPECPGKIYLNYLENVFNESAHSGEIKNNYFLLFAKDIINEWSENLNYESQITINASPFILTQFASIDDKPHIFIANFKGLIAEINAEQIPEKNIKVTLSDTNYVKAYLLPFMGEIQELETENKDGKFITVIPEIVKGGILWFE
jgi:hypothetical protein